MTSEVDIVNRSLASIGSQSQVSSINPSDGSAEANAAALLYYPTRDSLLRACDWNFARKQVGLTQLKSAYDTTPTLPVPWLYEYAYPSDCLDVHVITSGSWASSSSTSYTTADPLITYGQQRSGGTAKFRVSSDTDGSGNMVKVILTNVYQAVLLYTAQVTNPDLWDSMFADAMVASLAAKLVNPLSRNANLMVEQTKIAQAILVEAKARNANEDVPEYDRVPDWMSVRGILSHRVVGF